jgi:hypothetical protein
MNLDAAMREALIEALRSPEGRAAIRAAVVDAIPEPAPAPIPLHDPEEEISLKEAKQV